jgi:hypothetical protein
MMNGDSAELMKDGRRRRTLERPVWTGRMVDGEVSEGSLRNSGKLLCGSGGVEGIFSRLQEVLVEEVGV